MKKKRRKKKKKTDKKRRPPLCRPRNLIPTGNAILFNVRDFTSPSGLVAPADNSVPIIIFDQKRIF